MKRVGIIGLSHESNTFNARLTALEHFQSVMLARGEEVRTKYSASHHEIGGFLEGLAKEGVEAVPIFHAFAMPAGAVTAATLDRLLAMIMEGLDAAGPLDGLLVAPHGAGVSELHRDMDGYWLSQVRAKVGPKMPIICTIDPHANLTQKMIDACDATIAYRSNPHLDQKQRGLEAAALMCRTLRGEIRPVQAAAFPPIAINIERQYTPGQPCLAMYQFADEILKRPGVLSDSIVLGFPYADVEEMGSAFIVVTDGDKALAQRSANDLGAWLVAHRQDFVAKLISIPDAVQRGITSPGPVLLLDMGDNAGGGSPGDGTLLAHEIDRVTTVKSFVCLYDPKAQDAARAAGVGARLTLKMGAKHDHLHGEPFETAVTVRGLFDGKYHEPQPRHGGITHFDIGLIAVVETDRGMTLQLTSKPSFPTSLVQLTAFGLDPSSFQIIVAKGVHAPVGAYVHVCKTMIRVNTPGITSADMSRFEYRHRRHPLFPFEPLPL